MILLIDFCRLTCSRSSYAVYNTSPKSEGGAVKSYKLSLYQPSTLRPQDLTACLKLVEKTSGKHYRESKDGWSGKKKRKEMELWDLKYVVVREVGRGIVEGEGDWEDEEEDEGGNEEGKGEENSGHSKEMKKEIIVEESGEEREGEGEIKGFMSLMPTFEDGIKVVYLYEIHLIDELRGSVSLFLLLTSS